MESKLTSKQRKQIKKNIENWMGKNRSKFTKETEKLTPEEFVKWFDKQIWN